MRAGRLRHRFEFKSSTGAQNAFGESIETWETYATLWGQLEPLRGEEIIHARQVTATVSHRLRVRYNSSIAPEHRAVFDSRTFEINSVINVRERNREMELYCTEVI